MFVRYSLASVLCLVLSAGSLAACSSGASDNPAGGSGAGSTAGGTTGAAGTGQVSSGGSSAGSGVVGMSGAGGGVIPSGGNSSVGGSEGTAGSVAMGGNASMGGSGSMAGSGGSDSAGGRPSGPSMGCNMPPPGTEAFGMQVKHNISITGMAQQYVAGYTNRQYCTTIPQNYDPTKAYPVVFYGPGCGATGCEGNSFTGSSFKNDIFIVQAISALDAKGATIVPPSGAPGCFQAGKEGTADSPDGPYFDQVMAEVESKYCIDKGRIFAAGTSSGAWLSNYLACARGNVIRGTAADSGGLQHDSGMCTGGASVMEMPGDSTVTMVNGFDIGSGQARDMFIKLNGCSMTPTMMSFGNAMNCQVYGGCASPVVWCDVGGAHQSGNSYLAASSWALWSTLK